MRIALPAWNELVSPVLDTAGHLVIVEIIHGKIEKKYDIPISGLSPTKKTGIIVDHADMLICGGVSREMMSSLSSQGVEVIPWTMGDVESLITGFIDGSFPGPESVMPGCGNRRRRGADCIMRPRRDTGDGKNMKKTGKTGKRKGSS